MLRVANCDLSLILSIPEQPTLYISVADEI